MFESRERSIVIPQSEHGRFAGLLAWLWGNSDFELPPVKRDSFVAGIALHDRGHGFLDTLPIGRSSESDWLAATRKGFTMQFADPIADLIARFHLRRLVRANHAEAGRTLLEEMDTAIANELSVNGLSEVTLEQIDTITHFCDKVSFDFCFESPTSGELAVWSGIRRTPVPVQYEIRGELVQIQPWTLSVPSYSTYIVGYQRDLYPRQLEPVIVPIQISPTA